MKSVNKPIIDCCLDCGNKYGDGKKKGYAIGMWKGTCDICGKENVACASAGHDFGIYNNDEEKKIDKLMRKI